MRNMKIRDTCTACAGSMVLEFAALSRLTGDDRYVSDKIYSYTDWLTLKFSAGVGRNDSQSHDLT